MIHRKISCQPGSVCCHERRDSPSTPGPVTYFVSAGCDATVTSDVSHTTRTWVARKSMPISAGSTSCLARRDGGWCEFVIAKKGRLRTDMIIQCKSKLCKTLWTACGTPLKISSFLDARSFMVPVGMRVTLRTAPNNE